METTYEVFRNVQFVLYPLVAVLAFVGWRDGRGASRAWVAATFGSIAVVVVAGRFFSEDPTGGVVDRFARETLVAVLLLFPYCLHRFTATMHAHVRWYRRLATALTVAVCGGIFFFTDLPAKGEPQSGAIRLYVLLLATQWVLLCAVSGVVLWRGGSGQPTVARRRMRLLSMASVGMALALIAGMLDPSEQITVAQLVGQVIGLLSLPMFLLGVSPPAALLAVWRRPELRELQVAERGLMMAETPEEVAASILVHAARVVGGRAAALMFEGRVVGTFGMTQAEADEMVRCHDEPVASDGTPTLRIAMRDGCLGVFASPFSPYFGRDEADLLQGLAAMAELALERTRALSREREHSESLREFVAIASHDLRTPLTVIKGFTALMEERWTLLPDVDKRGYLATIDRQADQLARLVDDLLTISRIEGDALQPRAETVALVDAVEDALEAFPEARGDVGVDVAADLGVAADPTHVQRILRNMIGNALGYGEPPVEVTARRVPGAVEIRVCDHGPGVPEAFVPQLFGKFARLDKKLSTATKGTGLGLYIVRGLARAAGGDAWYEPTGTGGGACFAVRLLPAQIEATEHRVAGTQAVG